MLVCLIFSPEGKRLLYGRLEEKGLEIIAKSSIRHQETITFFLSVVDQKQCLIKVHIQ